MNREDLDDLANNTDTCSPEEIEAWGKYADQLALAKGFSKVHVCLQVDPKTFERKVCLIQHPNFTTQLSIMDKMTQMGLFMGANDLRESCLMKEESDAITYGDSMECEPYKMGVVSFCVGIIETIRGQYKKK